jgi:tripartite ATP-independent transporter DctM subunit
MSAQVDTHAELVLPDDLAAPRRPLPRAFAVLDTVVMGVLVVAFVAELGIMLGNLVGRAFGHGLTWSLEAAVILLSVMTFFGGAKGYGGGQQIRISVLVDRLSSSRAQMVEATTDWLVLLLAAVLVDSGMSAAAAESAARTPLLNLPMSIYGYIFAAGMFVTGLYAIGRLLARDRRAALLGLAGAVVIAAVVYLPSQMGLIEPTSTSGPLWVMLGLTVLLIALGLPLSFVFAGAAGIFMLYGHAAPVENLQTTMQNGVSGFVLLAIPFFVFAGLILAAGGLSDRLADAARGTVVRYRGGLMQSSIVSMFIFSGVSGAKIADIAAVGAVMKPVLEEEGYDPAESAAVFSAAAAMGETVPPSVVLLILASLTVLTPASLFIGGILPAIVLALTLMLVVRLRNDKRSDFRDPRGIPRLLVRALPVLILPAFLLVGLVAGFATPTEVSAIAVVYGIVLTGVVYRTLTLRRLLRVLSETATMSGMILLIVAAASAFTWALNLAQVPQAITDALGNVSDGWVLVLLTIVVLPFFGSLLEGLPALLVFAPLLLPQAERLGLDPLAYGLLLIIVLGIGAFSPPFGVGFYTSCTVLGASARRAASRTLIYMSALLVGCLVIGFIPRICTALPDLLGVT